MTLAVILAAPLLIAAMLMAVRFVGCTLDADPIPQSYSGIVAQSDGLISLWELNDSSPPTAVDHMNRHDGTYHGGVSNHVKGLVSAAAVELSNFGAEFDGKTGFVEVPFTLDLNAPEFSVEALVQPAGVGTGRQVIVESGGAYQLAVHGTDFEASVGGANGFQPPVVVHAREAGPGPFYTAMTYDGSTLSLWVNPAASDGEGTFLDQENPDNSRFNSASRHIPPATGGALHIGASADANAPGEFFAGTLQDVAVYNRALSFKDVVNHWSVFATGFQQVGEDGASRDIELGNEGTLSATAAFAPHDLQAEPPMMVGTTTYTIPPWCNYVDLFLIGGGGGASSNNGGLAGAFKTTSLWRGPGDPPHGENVVPLPPTTTLITMTVGAGGAGGTVTNQPTNGGDTTATADGISDQTAEGGGAAGSSSLTGVGPQPSEQTLGPTTETAGSDQTNAGQPGNEPGGGGAGGGFFAGGSGADGIAWVVARQINNS
ncbi:MAG: hypothetical protein QOH60_5088 [Mycobacterium sp.]|jgi:hypothetical protein|nr:hypothetical protein [Mycobacterium sp.]